MKSGHDVPRALGRHRDLWIYEWPASVAPIPPSQLWFEISIHVVYLKFKKKFIILGQ